LPQQALGGIRNLDQEFGTAPVASACFDRLSSQARDDLKSITLQQIAGQFFAKRVVESAGHGSGAAERRPPPKSRREGA